MGHLTVLTSSAIAAKQIGGSAPVMAKYYSHHRVPINSFDTMVEALRSLETETTSFVIRGDVPADAGARVRRTKDSMIAVAPQWLCIDIDKRAIKSNAFIDAHSAAIELRSLLPDGLSAAQCYVQFTASTNKTTASAHIWFWLPDQLSNPAAKRLLRVFDTALYTSVQPHFTALPLGEDPMVQRTVLLSGEAPHIGAENDRLREEAEAKLATSVARILRNGEDRHPVVNREAYRIGHLVGAGLVSYERANRVLISAASSAIHPLPIDRAEREVGAGLLDGAKKPDQGLVRTDKGAIKPILTNAVELLMGSEWGSALYKDLFRGQIVVGPPKETDLPLTDNHITDIALYLEDRTRGGWATATVVTAIAGVAEMSAVDPVLSWLEGLRWDGKRRLSRWLHRYCETEDTDYTRGVSRAVLTALVARQYAPGAEVHSMPVLVSRTQGTGKTTTWKILGGDYYVPFAFRERDRDELLKLRGALIAEDDEMRSTAATLAGVKSFLTTSTDKYREPYARTTTSTPRRAICVGSTNQEYFLRDATGNRRFWPVMVGRPIDHSDKLLRDRDQLFAEAVVAYKGGEQWHEVPDAAANAAKFSVSDPLEAVIRAELRICPRSLNHLLEECNLPLSTSYALRVRNILSAMPRVTLEGGKYCLKKGD